MTNNIAKIRAALKNRATAEETIVALAALAELEKAAGEPVATVLGIVVEWTGEQPPEAGTKLYAAPPAPGMFTAEEMEAAKLAAYRAGADKAIAEMIRTS